MIGPNWNFAALWWQFRGKFETPSNERGYTTLVWGPAMYRFMPTVNRKSEKECHDGLVFIGRLQLLLDRYCPRAHAGLSDGISVSR